MTTKQQPFRRGPLLGHQQSKGRGGRMSRWCSPKITHYNMHGNKANNTKMNIGHSFKDTEVKLLPFKSSTTKQNFLELPSVLRCFNVSRVHTLVRALFPTNPIPEVPLAGRLKFFYSNWAKLTQDLNILNTVQGFEIPILQNTVQEKSTNTPALNQEQSKLVKEKLKEMLLEGVIQPVSPCKNQYLCKLFLVSKRDGGNRPVVNLKYLNNFIPYQHFKMDRLNLLQNILHKGYCMCKLDLKDA